MRRLRGALAVLVVLASASAAWGMPARAPAPSAGATSLERLAAVETFALALGDGALSGDPARRYSDYDLVVLDGASAPPAAVRALRSSGAIVLGYLSVGTIERYRPWYAAAKRYRMERWDDWPGEHFADVARPGYRALIARRVAPRILARGFDGLFLDNVDMIEGRPARFSRGMRSLVRTLGALAHRRGGLLMAQNGEDVIGPMLAHLDAWNREDVSTSYDFDRRRYLRVPPGVRAANTAALRRIARRVRLVTSTDYTRRAGDAAARRAIATACAARAVPFVSDIGLRRIPRRAPRCG